MASPPEEKRVIFVDTNVGTHMATSISPGITVGELKGGSFDENGQLEKEHFICFPDRGEFKACRLMVKRKLHLYHLPDPTPIKYAFHGLLRSWFLFMDLFPTGNLCNESAFTLATQQCPHKKITLTGSQSCTISETCDSISKVGNTTDCITITNARMNSRKNLRGSKQIISDEGEFRKCKRRKHALTNPVSSGRVDDTSLNHLQFQIRSAMKCLDVFEPVPNPDPPGLSGTDNRKINTYINGNDLCSLEGRQHGISLLAQTPYGSSSGNMSITGIISRYFCECDEVNSHYKGHTEDQRDIRGTYEQVGNVQKSESQNTADISAKQRWSTRKSISETDQFGSSSPLNDAEQLENFIPDGKEINEKEHTVFTGKKPKVKGINENDESACNRVCKKNTKSSGEPVVRACGPLRKSKQRKMVLPPPFEVPIENSSRRIRENEVGKCLLRAANNIGISSTTRSAATCFFASNHEKFVVCDTIFNISDKDG